jgi:hypothetical protein
MNKNSVLAITLAAVLTISVASFAGAGAAWADDDDREEKKEKRHDRLATFIKKIRDNDREHNAADVSFGSVKVSAKGLAVEKGNGAIETSDATLALTGSVFRTNGNHAKLFVNGTLDFGGDRYMVRAEGNVRLNDRLDFGHVSIAGKIFKESERKDYGFHAKAIALPTQADGTAWKLVGEQPAQAGRLAKIYALLGEMKLERAPAPAPTQSPDNAGLDRFMISRIGSQTAGSEFTFAVTAIDGMGRVNTGYTGTVSLTTNNGISPGGHASIMPATYTFTSADTGQHVFAAKMFNAKSDTVITVSGDGRTATSNAFAVATAPAASITVTPSSVTLGAGGVTTLAAQARDAYDNPITGATYSWSLGNLSIGTLVPSANTATFTAANLSAAASGAVGVTATYGGASASTSATVNVNPA